VHFFEVQCGWSQTIKEFGYPPILFNEIQLTMALWIKVTDMSTCSDQLLEHRLLLHKVRLAEKCLLAAAIGFLRIKAGLGALNCLESVYT
jgi:hypothetical protein